MSQTDLTASIPMVEKLESEAFPQVPRIGPYVLLDKLGEGGMGTVYAAYHGELDRQVAVKLLRSAGRVDGAAEVRLLREAQALAKLDHPNVVGVHDAGVYQGHVYLVMERVVGGTLSDWLKEKPRGWQEVRDAFVHAGEGLAAAHAAGLVHRDFKPANVLLGKDGRIKVADFGLARAASGADDALSPWGEGQGRGETATPALSRLSATVTQVGTVVGTRAYMAPEQFLGEAADAKSDQFSFSVALWDALYGQRPFKEVPKAGEPWMLTPPTEKREVPPFLKAAVEKGLSQSPAQRFPSMEALLEALVSDPAVRRRQLALRLGAAAVALGALAAVGVGVARQRDATARLCDKPVSSFAGIWDAPTKAALQAAFQATGLSYAEETAEKVVQAFDTYAADWENVDTRLCRATLIEKSQTEETRRQQSACLERRRNDVEAVAKLLASADAKMVEKAIQATGYLKHPSGCADLATLALEPPGPRDAKNAARVEQWRKELQRVDALTNVRRIEEAVSAAHAVESEAHSASEDAVEGEALHAQAFARTLEGNDQQAVLLSQKAIPLALAGRSDVVAFRACSSLTWALNALGKNDEAQLWLGVARGLVVRLGSPPEQMASLANSEMVQAWSRGDYAQGSRYAEQSLRLSVQALGERHPRTLTARMNLFAAYGNEGRYAEAVEEGRKLVEPVEHVFGPRNTFLAMVLMNYGEVLLGVGRIEEGLHIEERALDIAVEATGAASRWSLFAALNQVCALRKLGQTTRAQELILTTVATVRSIQGAGALLEATLLELGRVQRIRGELPAARRTFEELRGLITARVSADSPELVDVFDELGQLEWLAGQPAKALPLLEKALALRAKGGSKAGDPALTRFALARTLTALKKDPARSKELAQKAEAEMVGLDFMKKDLADVRTFLAGK